MLCSHICMANCRLCQDSVVVLPHTYCTVQYTLLSTVTKILSTVFPPDISEHRLNCPFIN